MVQMGATPTPFKSTGIWRPSGSMEPSKEPRYQEEALGEAHFTQLCSGVCLVIPEGGLVGERKNI